MKLALTQFNPIVGDLTGNETRMAESIAAAKEAGAELVIFGELSLVGYPPRDLLKADGFITANLDALERLAAKCDGIAALVGFVARTEAGRGKALQNAAALLADGTIQQVHRKTLLPTYDVFDERRYFEPAAELSCIEFAGHKIGLSICEDLWDAESLGRDLYGQSPIERLVEAGADVIVNMAASPFEMGKAARREELFARQAQRHGRPIVYVNQVGGNDELVFDGGSCVVGADGTLLARGRSFAEDQLLVDLDAAAPTRIEAIECDLEQLRRALQLGIRDYVHKCGFSDVVFGLSGGVDSALVAALAAEALGAEHVHTIAMPSRYSTGHSLSDADTLAANLGITCDTVAIEPMHTAYESIFGQYVADGNAEIADENIQARIRGALVMAYSNAHGNLPLATGNKSELAVGYCTLYGDMCGGLAPIGDVLKTTVYALCHHMNKTAGRAYIPEHILTKPPSAELRPDQCDQDKLPEYDVLDDILRRYIEDGKTAGEILAETDHDEALVRRIVRMTDLAEYKRQQAARVVKISPRAFGVGRRMPIAQRFRQ